MIAHVIGCGQTAKNFTPDGNLTIGVNDIFSITPVDYLIVINHPSKFKDEPERLNAIINSKPKVFYSNNNSWEKYFPEWKQLNMVSFSYSGRNSRIWCSKTSPFVGISLANHLGATDIVIWGVDFQNHKFFKIGTTYFNHEYSAYLKLFERVNAKVWLGSKGTCFDNDLLQWIPQA